MSIHLHIEAKDATDLEAQIQHLAGRHRDVVSGPELGQVVTLGDFAKPSGAAQVTDSPKKESAKRAPKAPEAPATPFAPIAEIIPVVVAKAGRPKILELFAKYGVSKGSELKTEQYTDFLADCKGALNGVAA